MKLCKECHILLPPTSFRSLRDGKSNIWYPRIVCRSCEYVKNSKRETVKRYRKLHAEKTKAMYGIGIATIRRFGLRTALFVYDRAKRKCELCNDANNLTIHHKDGNGRHNEEKGLPVNNDHSNLQVLCRSCHGGLHSRQYWQPKKE